MEVLNQDGSHKETEKSTFLPLIMARRIVLHAVIRPLRHSAHITSLSGALRPPCLLQLFQRSHPSLLPLSFPAPRKKKTNTAWLMRYGDVCPKSCDGLQIFPINAGQMIVIPLNAWDYVRNPSVWPFLPSLNRFSHSLYMHRLPYPSS